MMAEESREDTSPVWGASRPPDGNELREHDEQESQKQGPERREHPRYEVDCVMRLASLKGSVDMPGRLVNLSAGGCKVLTDTRFLAGSLVRVEVQFRLRGIQFRFTGVTQGSRSGRSFAIRFLDISPRRREELDEVLAELDKESATGPVP
jgi:c-di-GMP-binding flagellar brake protein YcgR